MPTTRNRGALAREAGGRVIDGSLQLCTSFPPVARTRAPGGRGSSAARAAGARADGRAEPLHFSASSAAGVSSSPEVLSASRAAAASSVAASGAASAPSLRAVISFWAAVNASLNLPACGETGSTRKKRKKTKEERRRRADVLRVAEADGEDLLDELGALGEVEAGPDPGAVRADVGLELDARVDDVVRDDLHRLLLAHEDADHRVLAVLEELDLPDAALDPLLLPRPLVQERLREPEELGPHLERHLLVLLVRLHVHLLQRDDGRELGRRLGLGGRRVVVRRALGRLRRAYGKKKVPRSAGTPFPARARGRATASPRT